MRQRSRRGDPQGPPHFVDGAARIWDNSSMLPRNQRMELLARAYVHAVIAQAGGICATPSPDYGVDLDVHSISEEGGTFTDEGAAFHLQLRSTTDAAYREADDAFHHDLDIKTYNFLRKADVRT